MAKLTRVPAKVFAASAAADEIGQFGSAVAGSKLETSDVSTIQALSAWLSGWSEALVSGNRYPALQEMNGLLKVLSYQGAYALQEGIPEYDAATTYYIGSIVKKTGTFEIYGSLTDDNVGNALTVDTEWKFLVDLSDIGGGGVVDFENYGEVTTNLTLLENKISTAYFSTTSSITLPTITDTAKQVTCILDFTTASSGQPTITNTNLKWSDKNGGKPPVTYSIISGVQNFLIFKSIWIGENLYWEAEYTTYGGVVTAWVQPTLTSNGTALTDELAVSGNADTSNVFKAFDNNSSTYWDPTTNGTNLVMITKKAIQVKSIALAFKDSGAIGGSGTLYGSTDGVTWTSIASYSGNASISYSFATNSSSFYQYHNLILIPQGSFTTNVQITLSAYYIST